MSAARAEIMGRIRAILEQTEPSGRASPDALRSNMPARVASVRVPVLPDYEQQFRAKAEANLIRTRDLASFEDVPKAVAEILAESNIASNISVAPELVPLAWPATVTVRSAKARLDEVLTVSLASAAIAETGSLVLCSGERGPSSLSYAAEVHVIVLARKDITPYLEDGLQAVKSSSQPWPRAVNVISGPSRTADVAGIVVRPAHGPKAVHLLIVG